MAITAYVKVDDQVVPLPGGEGGGSSGSVEVLTIVSSSRPTVLSAGTAFTVPDYIVGSNALAVSINGLRCAKGVEYNEVSSTAIAFTSDIPVDALIVATVTKLVGEKSTIEATVSNSRSSVLVAGTPFTVGTHEVGNASDIQVFLNGLALVPVVDYVDSSATAISFTSDIPSDFQIIAITRS